VKKLCSDETRTLANTIKRESIKARLEWMRRDIACKGNVDNYAFLPYATKDYP
jgi:hypothetical protein